MTGSNFILDTSSVIELFRGDPIVNSRLETETVLKIPSIVLGELYFGIYRSSNPAKHENQLQKFINNCEVLPIDLDTSKMYAIIKVKLLQKGKPIPENDIWLAAIAMQYNLLLVAFDKHFLEIDDLNVETWK